jgi:hypothetical protein
MADNVDECIVSESKEIPFRRVLISDNQSSIL